jgi:hypothetical protein
MKVIETAAVAGSEIQTNGDTIMKKIILGLVALTALSGAALAERTDIDPRDRNWSAGSASVTGDEAALLVKGGTVSKQGLSSYERVMQQSIENENSHN